MTDDEVREFFDRAAVLADRNGICSNLRDGDFIKRYDVGDVKIVRLYTGDPVTGPRNAVEVRVMQEKGIIYRVATVLIDFEITEDDAHLHRTNLGKEGLRGLSILRQAMVLDDLAKI